MRSISVLIIRKNQKDGIVSNASFVVGLTAGRLLPDETFGSDAVTDGDGRAHRFLTRIPHHVREAGDNKMRSLFAQFTDNPDVSVVTYTEDAAPSSYEKYAENLANHSGEEISFRALHIFGPEDVVVPATKNLSRL